MRILSVADRVDPNLYHKQAVSRLPKIDLILSCGDLAPEYLSFLAHTFKVPLGYVRGNHDIRHDQAPPQGCIDLDGRITQLNGLHVLGLQGSRWYNGGPCQYTEKQMLQRIRRLWLPLWRQKKLDMIITHAPPRLVHDAEDPCHRGFHCFHRLIQRHTPRYLLHGHIHRLFDHPWQRLSHVSHTRVINTYGYHIFEVDHHETVR